MKIVACYKLVPEDRDISVNPDLTLDLSNATWKVGDYDLTAIEMATGLAGVPGGFQRRSADLRE